MMKDYDYLSKINIVGNAGVGKTCLLQRYIYNQFTSKYKRSIGVSYISKHIESRKIIHKVQFWDTTGNQRYRIDNSAFYNCTIGIILIYDITDISTFKDIYKWIEEVRQYCRKDVGMVLVGNKADLEGQRQVSEQEGKACAQMWGMDFVETSARDAINVEQAFTLGLPAAREKGEKDKENSFESE